MGKRQRYRDHVDPEYRRWGRTYARFPGVNECVRLIKERKASGAWGDIIVHQLAENAGRCLSELIDAYHGDSDGDVRMYVMMALEIAQPPEAVPFLEQVLREGDPRFAPYAQRTLRGIGTRAARALRDDCAAFERVLRQAPARTPVAGDEWAQSDSAKAQMR